MWAYQKRLQFPIDIKKKDVKMAKAIISQYGGPQGELAAAIRYLNQRYTMPDDRGKALLTDIGTEELAHVEMVSTMVTQLMKGATIEEIKANGLEAYYTEHGMDLFPEKTPYLTPHTFYHKTIYKEIPSVICSSSVFAPYPKVSNTLSILYKSHKNSKVSASGCV